MKKTFVLMVAKEFLKGHPKAGQPTSFDEFILAELANPPSPE